MRVVRWTLHFLAISFITSSIGTEARGQTVAEAARQERERRKTVQTKTVITNADVVTSPAAASASATESKPEQSAATVGPKDKKGRDEKYWRSAFEAARQELKRAQDKVQVAQLKVNDLNMMLLRQSDVYNRENRIGPDLADAKTQLAAAEQEVRQAQQKIADLEEELRRSGGLPGWAR
jgi:hypothetical protein